MTGFDYDLFVIGAGSGGVRAARIAAGHGARVAIAEEYRIGGTCVIRGCVPKKMLVYASQFSASFRDSAGYGWTAGPAAFDWQTLIANKDREIARLSGIYEANLRRSQVEIFRERATFAGRHEIALAASGRRITADKILIATGGAPVIPDIPGCEHIATSNEAFDLKKLPARVLIVGGGYIAVEFAGIFHGLGSAVTLVHRGSQILRGFDQDLRDGLAGALAAKGLTLTMNAQVTAIAKDGDAYGARLSTGETVISNLVMFAAGRSPATTGLGLEAAGVEAGLFGAIAVDQFSQTSAGNVYAVGDVTNRANLTPAAIREGHAFADTVFGGDQTPVRHELIPTAVFSQPEIGTVGLTEEAARMAGAVDVYKTTFRPMKYLLAGRDERMTMKLIVSSETNRVMGCHILGPDAGEMIQLAAVAMQAGATKRDFDATLAVHPTAAEELVTMREPWAAPVK